MVHHALIRSEWLLMAGSSGQWWFGHPPDQASSKPQPQPCSLHVNRLHGRACTDSGGGRLQRPACASLPTARSGHLSRGKARQGLHVASRLSWWSHYAYYVSRFPYLPGLVMVVHTVWWYIQSVAAGCCCSEEKLNRSLLVTTATVLGLWGVSVGPIGLIVGVSCLLFSSATPGIAFGAFSV